MTQRTPVDSINSISVTCFPVAITDVAEQLDFALMTNPRPVSSKTGPIDHAMFGAQPSRGGQAAKKIALHAFGPSKTTMVTNVVDGWHTAVVATSADIPGRVWQFTMSSDDDPLGLNMLQVAIRGRVLRVVLAQKEQRWVFHQQGPPQAEEDPEAYKQRRIKVPVR